jgi:NAD(P)-dependent dehydrogenase (short-subunit alcohol dehydrogenase family)
MVIMDLGLTNKCVAILGGTDGLGLALARQLVEEGAMVAVCGRDAGRLAQAQEVLGERALCLMADVTVPEEITAFLDEVLASFGRLDGLVNNAGRLSAVPVVSASDEEWQQDFELKVMAAVRATRHVASALIASQGAVINVLAISARTPTAGSTPTAANRAAGLALTKALANELGPQGVRVNALLVGKIRSGQWVRMAEAAGVALEDFYEKAAARDGIPLGRYGHAEEFANVATFLLSPRASYLHGVGLSIDGGLSPVI